MALHNIVWTLAENNGDCNRVNAVLSIRLFALQGGVTAFQFVFSKWHGAKHQHEELLRLPTHSTRKTRAQLQKAWTSLLGDCFDTFDRADTLSNKFECPGFQRLCFSPTRPFYHRTPHKLPRLMPTHFKNKVHALLCRSDPILLADTFTVYRSGQNTMVHCYHKSPLHFFSF